jgi:hypothetical protein
VPNSTAARTTAAIATPGADDEDRDIGQSVAAIVTTLRRVAVRPSTVWAWTT